MGAVVGWVGSCRSEMGQGGVGCVMQGWVGYCGSW